MAKLIKIKKDISLDNKPCESISSVENDGLLYVAAVLGFVI